MLILGIDPGTARTGYALVDLQSRPKLIESSTIITPAEIEMHKRLKILYRELNDVVKKHSPEIMVVERLFFNTNVKTAIAVGQSRGISLLVAANKNMKVFEYTALEAKLSLTGYGRASKKEMQEAVMSMLKLDGQVKSDDANDAVAMALCYLMKEFAALMGPIPVLKLENGMFENQNKAMKAKEKVKNEEKVKDKDEVMTIALKKVTAKQKIVTKKTKK